jgi:exodeoxyribonuclease V alpha subunit
VRAAIPVKVSTLHRLLGSRPDTRHFRHHAGNPLALDVLVIDEASMVDLEMMAAVLAALPPAARLILLGDKDQLASVEAGAVLGELCRHARAGHYTPATRDWLARPLRRTHRPSASSTSGQCARAGGGDAPSQLPLLCGERHRPTGGSGERRRYRHGSGRSGGTPMPTSPCCRWPAGDETLASRRWSSMAAAAGQGADPAPARRACPDGVATRLSPLPHDPRRDPARSHAGQEAFDDWARRVLRAHGEFQVLCALRRGPWGVAGLNQRIARVLCAAALIPASAGWYPGRPVLVTRNDYGLGLMNGDIGITLALPPAAGQEMTLRVAFPPATPARESNGSCRAACRRWKRRMR